jgi:hypothetical protein
MRALLLVVLLAVLAGCEEAKLQPKAVAKKPIDQSGKRIIETMESQRGQVVKQEPTPKPDKEWIADARRHFLAAKGATLKAQGDAMRANNQRLGAMTKVDRVQGLQACRLVKEKGIGNVAPQIRETARGFAPDYIRVKELDEASAIGERPGYPGQDRRKKLWDMLSNVVGPLSGSHDVTAFAMLTEKELRSAIRAADNAVAGGLGSVSREDRQLLLAVGALEWFGKQLDTEKTNP